MKNKITHCAVHYGIIMHNHSTGPGLVLCEEGRKEERSKQGHTNNKAKQHNTPMYTHVYNYNVHTVVLLPVPVVFSVSLLRVTGVGRLLLVRIIITPITFICSIHMYMYT